MSRSGRNARAIGLSTRPKDAAKDAAPVGETVVDELRQRYDKLTQSQKRIAEYIVDHPDRVAFATVDQLANELGINPSTIVRFAYRLGMKGFPELQERMRQLVRGQLSQASRVVDPGTIDPEQVITHGIFVDTIVEVAAPRQEEALIRAGAVYV